MREFEAAMALFGLPGMAFPEMVKGDLSAVPGADFPDAPAEGPVLTDLSDADYVVPVGIANDMLGYIIPKGQWDVAPPFIDGDVPPYGETISPGPRTAGIVLEAFVDLTTRVK